MRSNLPDPATAVVKSKACSGPLRFNFFPFHQPAEPDRVHAHLEGFMGAPLYGNRLFIEHDGVWVESGLAPSPVGPSWHPDLDLSVGTDVDIARHVLRAIGPGSQVEIAPTLEQDASIGTVAMFSKPEPQCPALTKGRYVPDYVLDAIPMVRRVERMASGLVEYLGIETWDDGSGLKEEFTLRISEKHLELIHSEISDIDLRITSYLEGNEWHHATCLLLPVSLDPINVMRSLKAAPQGLHKLIKQFSEDDSKLLRLLRDDAVIRSIGQKLVDDQQGSRPKLEILFEPGTLFAK